MEKNQRFRLIHVFDSSKEFGLASEVYAIEDKKLKEWAIVDCSNHSCSKKVLRAIEKNGIIFSKIKLIILTHHHFDHVGFYF